MMRPGRYAGYELLLDHIGTRLPCACLQGHSSLPIYHAARIAAKITSKALGVNGFSLP